jgi:hypothetical protein
MTKKMENGNCLKEEINKVYEDAEAERNIVGFFDLLLKVDRRNNPHFYPDSEADKYD